jgi:septal ring factor EnvC (AmiA/AmiB activator)
MLRSLELPPPPWLNAAIQQIFPVLSRERERARARERARERERERARERERERERKFLQWVGSMAVCFGS